jgi:hypothetical protein
LISVSSSHVEPKTSILRSQSWALTKYVVWRTLFLSTSLAQGSFWEAYNIYVLPQCTEASQRLFY